MIDLLLEAAMAPFTFAFALLFGLLAVELVFALMGGTLLGLGGEPEVDLPGMDTPDIGDLDIDLDLDGVDVEIGDLELPDLDGMGDAPAASGPSAWLGFGRVPFLIWLGALLLGFGLTGFVLQNLALSIAGAMLPALVAIIPAGIAGLWFAGRFGAVFARLLPKTETEAVSERHLGRRTGTVTQGTAARGRPAEVRVIDRFGNFQYLRAEPLRDDAQIGQGARVIVLRHRIEGGYLLVPLDA